MLRKEVQLWQKEILAMNSDFRQGLFTRAMTLTAKQEQSKEIITGNKIDALSDVALSRLLKRNNIFAKLSPIQKARIVRVLKQNGNVVGYMGDGINDSPALTNSDVGISVDTAVDIAKETADIILLEKDLNVLLDGVMERKKNICKFNEIYKNGNKF